MLSLILASLLSLQDPVTVDEVLRLTGQQAGDEAILERIGSTSFTLVTDDLVKLKQAGVSDRVLKRMISGPREIRTANCSHKDVRLQLLKGKLDINLEKGQSLTRGADLTLPGSGLYAITVEGRQTTHAFSTPATLTFKGCDIDNLEVLTLQIKDADGSRTMIVQTRSKTPAAAGVYAMPRAPYRGLPPGSARIMRGGLLNCLVDGVTSFVDVVADVLWHF